MRAMTRRRRSYSRDQLSTWQTDFASDPNVVGSTIYVQTHPFTVAGVAPPGFFGDRIIPNPPDFWMPLASEPVIEGANSALKQSNEEWLYPIGRVRPGINIGTLQAKLSVAIAAMAVYADFIHRARRHSHDSPATRDSCAGGRRNPAIAAAADRHGLADADDSLHGGAAHCVREYCESDACAMHRATLGYGCAHGAGSGAPQAHSPDSDRKRGTKPDWRSGWDWPSRTAYRT